MLTTFTPTTFDRWTTTIIMTVYVGFHSSCSAGSGTILRSEQVLSFLSPRSIEHKGLKSLFAANVLMRMKD